jgi:hypothetical protein
MIIRNVDESNGLPPNVGADRSTSWNDRSRSSAVGMLREALIAHPRGSLAAATVLGVIVGWIVKRRWT